MPDFVYDAGPILQLPVCADAPGPARDGRDPARAAAAGPFHARVLEIGCGAGGNLMAMAAATPGIRALGRRPGRGADRGRPACDRRDRADQRRAAPRRRPRAADGSLGEFDYIVAHGVYGWIPPDARDALLATIRVAPGAATASPTCPTTPSPGGYFRRMLRDGGLWHARDVDPDDAPRAPRRRRSCTGSSTSTGSSDADTYGALLEREIPPLANAPALPARARRPQRALARRLVRGLRRARRRATGWATSARPTCTACAPRCCPTRSSPRCGSWPAATGSRSRTTPTC